VEQSRVVKMMAAKQAAETAAGRKRARRSEQGKLGKNETQKHGVCVRRLHSGYMCGKSELKPNDG
jgi:hypothetical protein